MKRAIIAASLAAFTIAPLPVQLSAPAHAQAGGTNSGLPGGHPHSDYSKDKPGNGDHGNDGGNGG
jgi:hypothetical protein